MTRLLTSIVQWWSFLNASEPDHSGPAKASVTYYGRPVTR